MLVGRERPVRSTDDRRTSTGRRRHPVRYSHVSRTRRRMTRLVDDSPVGMTPGTPPRQPDDTSRSDDWRTISEEVLQGLVHALNNRVAALSAFVELAKLGDEEGDPVTVLPVEIAQLHRLNALFGMLPERKSDPEALELRVVIDDVIRLHEHHPRLRGERVAVAFEGAPAVVRAPRWALVRALVMLVHSAKHAAESGQAPDGAILRERGYDTTDSVHAVAAVQPPADLIALAERSNGSVARETGELVLRMPSVRELRRREREGRGESSPA